MSNGVEEYYNEDTGQNLLIVDSETHYVGSYAQQEAQKRFAIKDAGGRKDGFFWNGLDHMDFVIKTLTAPQCGYLLLISSYMDWTGLIVKSERDPTPMMSADIIKALRLPKGSSTFYDFRDACIDSGILNVDTDGYYYVAKQFHFKGGLKGGQRVVKTYITRLREMHKEISANDIGLLYCMIPYMHRESNILCVNPEEIRPRRVNKLNRRKLAEVVGVDPSVISNAVRRMIFEDKSVFAKISTATDGTFYMINPKVLSRNEREYDVAVRTIFGLE